MFMACQDYAHLPLRWLKGWHKVEIQLKSCQIVQVLDHKQDVVYWNLKTEKLQHDN